MLTSVLDGRVFGERTGPAGSAALPRVLALHGWARTRADLLPVLTGDPDGPVDGLALDLPGFGATPAPPAAWSTREYAEQLVPLVEAAERPVVIVGHSFGGRVAVHLAALMADRLAGLVLTGTPSLVRLDAGARASKPPLAYRLGRAAHRRGLLPDARLELLRQRYGSADYKAAHGVMRDVLVKAVSEDYADLLPRVTCPVHLVWGEHDTAAPAAMARAAAERFPDARLTVVPGSGHLLDPALYAELHAAVRALLAGAAAR